MFVELPSLESLLPPKCPETAENCCSLATTGLYTHVFSSLYLNTAISTSVPGVLIVTNELFYHITKYWQETQHCALVLPYLIIAGNGKCYLQIMELHRANGIEPVHYLLRTEKDGTESLVRATVSHLNSPSCTQPYVYYKHSQLSLHCAYSISLTHTQPARLPHSPHAQAAHLHIFYGSSSHTNQLSQCSCPAPCSKTLSQTHKHRARAPTVTYSNSRPPHSTHASDYLILAASQITSVLCSV